MRSPPRSMRLAAVVAAAVICVLCSASEVRGEIAAPEIISVASAETDAGSAYRQGSVEGGTRLWVRGINFSEEPGGNLLFIDGEPCAVIEFLTTSVVIVADTPRLADRSKVGKGLSVDVLVDGRRRASTWRTFVYLEYRTPQLDAVYPRAASAGSTVSIVGYLRGGKSPGEFRSIDVGPARCLAVGKDDENADAQLNTERGVDCAVGGGADPGYYNVSVTTDQYDGKSFVPSWFRYPAMHRQGLTLVHFSAQPEPFWH